MPRLSSYQRPWYQHCYWGDYASTSDFPNVSGSSTQDDNLNLGDLCLVTGTAQLYICTARATGAATWAKLAHDGSTVASLTLSSTLTLGTGGIVPITAPTGVVNWQNNTATSGTDTTPADGTQFVTSIFLPADMTITNINYLIGSVGGTNKVYGVIYSSAGAVLANTSLTGGGATVGTAANIQTLALTSTYAAKGPARFFIGISINGNTARLRTVPAFCSGGLYAGSVSQTHGTSPTVAAITAPSTFTADKAPVVFLD